MDKMNSQSCVKDALNHIKNDVNYPASKQDIIQALVLASAKSLRMSATGLRKPCQTTPLTVQKK